MRGRMTGMERRGYPSPFLLGAPVVYEGVARVMASDDPRFRVGEVVVGMLPWMKRSILD
jgi:NADPH-dependent curcumin reductase CurA